MIRSSVTILTLFIFIAQSGCGMRRHFVSREESRADSSYIYALPFPSGQRHLLIQGYNSGFSHKRRLALDFTMKKGSPVTAARDGVVTRVEQGFTKGGINKKYFRKANQVVLRHADGTQAYYGHLQHNGVVVKVGDSVRTGQVIARSGSTGYSALPHLHFMVWGPNSKGVRSQMPTRFRTTKGVGYLKPGKRYRNIAQDTGAVAVPVK